MSTPSALTTYTSLIAPPAVVRLDAWGENPLLQDAQQVASATVAAATATNGNPPTMFEVGPLPLFLASGVDPRFLKVLPWRVRHAAAMNNEAGEVLAWVEQYAYDPDIEIQSPGLTAYISRFRDWFGGRWTNPNFRGADPAQATSAEDGLYAALFADSDAAHAAKIAPINAAAAAFDQARTSAFRVRPGGAA